MSRLEMQALDEYVSLLKDLEKEKVVDAIHISIYEGAALTADAIKDEIKNMNVSDNLMEGITQSEKDDLINGFGISKMQNNGGDTNVKIGFDGYGHKTRKYKKGVPVALTARAIISGTSFRRKNDFVRKAVNRIRKKAVQRMDDVINEIFKKEME